MELTCELTCKCHLCTGEMTPNPPHPTILCFHLSLWRTQLTTKCCCELHDDCDWLRQKCPCPKCCDCRKLQLGDHTYPCMNCKRKFNTFTPCLHQEMSHCPYYCEKYINMRKRKLHSFNKDTRATKITKMM